MKSLYTLGCSFMSTDTNVPDQPTFLDQLAQQRSWQHVNLARAGASNFMIRLQIAHAIEHTANYVIVGATSSDRVDLVDENPDYRSPIKLEHIRNRGYNCAVENTVNDRNAFITSDTINNLLESRHARLPAHRVDSLKHYAANIHEHGLQAYKDYFVVRDGLRDLAQAQIPFVFIPGPMHYFDWTEFTSNLWTGTQPWDMPNGIYNHVVNHNPPSAHEIFFQNILIKTANWA
jgi:hypothetical protein